MSIKLSDVVILNINGADYCCIINGISKGESVNLLRKAELKEKCATLKIIKNYFSM